MRDLTVDWVDGVERWWRAWASEARTVFSRLDRQKKPRTDGATPSIVRPDELSEAIRAYAQGRNALERLRANLFYVQGLYPVAMTGRRKADIGAKADPRQGRKLRITLPRDDGAGFDRYQVPNFPARVAYLIDDVMEILRYGEKYERWSQDPLVDQAVASGRWMEPATATLADRIAELRPHLAPAQIGRIGLLDLRRVGEKMASLFEYLRGAAKNLAAGVRAATAAGHEQADFRQGIPEANLGDVKVVLDTKWISASTAQAMAQQLQRDPREFATYVKIAQQAQRAVQRAGFGFLWYGRVAVIPESVKQIDPSISQTTVASYARSLRGERDYILVYGRKNVVMIADILHELGHRYWYRFLPRSQREQWASRHGEVPTTAYGGTNAKEEFGEAFAEYVLGRLRGAERQRFESVVLSDGKPFRRQVEDVMRQLLRRLEEATGGDVVVMAKALLAQGFSADMEDAEALADDLSASAIPRVTKASWKFRAMQWKEERDSVEHDFRVGNPHDMTLSWRYPSRIEAVGTLAFDVQWKGTQVSPKLGSWLATQAMARNWALERDSAVFLTPSVRANVVEAAETFVLDKLALETQTSIVDPKTGRSERASEIPSPHYQVDMNVQYDDAQVRGERYLAVVTLPIAVRKVLVTFPWDYDYDR